MILAYYNASFNYSRVVQTLQIEPELGTPFSSIKKLERLGILVGYRENGSLETIHRLLTYGWPCIMSVDTGELAYWQVSTGHAVVLAGMDSDSVYLHDPEMTEGPIQVTIDEFYLAWYEQLLSYAVLSVL